MKRLLLAILCLGGCQQMSAGEAVSDPTAGAVPVASADGEVPRSGAGDPPRAGSVLLNSDVADGAEASYVNWVFADTTPDTGCMHAVVGDCTLDVCAPSGDPPMARYYAAGAVTVRGGLYDVSAQATADGSYPESTNSTHRLWRGGELLTVAGSGGVVPPFSLIVPAPSPLVVTTPQSAASAKVDRTQDLIVRWGGVDNDVEISIGADGDANSYGSLVCRVSGAAGSYAVPSSVLSQLPAGTGTLLVESVSQRAAAPGSWVIYAYARSLAVDVSGAGFRTPATIQ